LAPMPAKQWLGESCQVFRDLRWRVKEEWMRRELVKDWVEGELIGGTTMASAERSGRSCGSPRLVCNRGDGHGDVSTRRCSVRVWVNSWHGQQHRGSDTGRGSGACLRHMARQAPGRSGLLSLGAAQRPTVIEVPTGHAVHHGATEEFVRRSTTQSTRGTREAQRCRHPATRFLFRLAIFQNAKLKSLVYNLKISKN
jgi:hypothetical protein